MHTANSAQLFPLDYLPRTADLLKIVSVPLEEILDQDRYRWAYGMAYTSVELHEIDALRRER